MYPEASCPASSSLPVLSSLLLFCSSLVLSRSYPQARPSPTSISSLCESLFTSSPNLDSFCIASFCPLLSCSSHEPLFLIDFIVQLVPIPPFPASQLVPILLPAGLSISCPALAFWFLLALHPPPVPISIFFTAIHSFLSGSSSLDTWISWCLCIPASWIIRRISSSQSCSDAEQPFWGRSGCPVSPGWSMAICPGDAAWGGPIAHPSTWLRQQRSALVCSQSFFLKLGSFSFAGSY